MKTVHVEIEIFGRFRVWVNGKPMPWRTIKLTHPWQMFILLAQNKGGYLSNHELIRKLWDDQPITDTTPEAKVLALKNNLKNVALRLRKELAAMTENTDTLLECEVGGYTLGEGVTYKIDLLAFYELCENLHNGEHLGPEELMTLFEELFCVYKADIAYQPSNPAWLKELADTCAERFMQTISEGFSILWRNGMYHEIVGFYQRMEAEHTTNEEIRLYNYHAQQELRACPNVVGGFHRLSTALP
jgi:DNA-binding SARP family transcriptional activator